MPYGLFIQNLTGAVPALFFLLLLVLLDFQAKYSMKLMSVSCADQQNNAIYVEGYSSLLLLWNDTKNAATWKVNLAAQFPIVVHYLGIVKRTDPLN